MDFLGGDLPLAALLEDPLLHLPGLPEHSSLRIPPLQDPVPFHTHSRPSPLEPSAGGDREAQNSKAKLSSQKGIQKQSANAAEGTNVGVTHGYDGTFVDFTRPPNQQLPKTALPLTISLRVLEKKGSDLFDQDGPRKRIRLDESEKTPDFVKLPKPHARTQKEQQMLPTFGPFTILNGLVEPPPNAGLLPPIEPDSIKSSIPPISETTPPADVTTPEKKKTESTDGKQTPHKTPTAATGKKEPRSRRKFCKWSGAETNDLLKGVAKHGIGNWKLILDDPGYHFNDRKPTDLKDRFRVCCPNAYHNKVDGNDVEASMTTASTVNATSNSQTPNKAAPQPKTSTSAIHTSNILLPQSPSPTLSTPQPPTPTDSVPTPAKSKAHALPQSALQDLGITKFTPSPRRSRRPFTPDEDANLLRGIAAHGFAWSTIQKDNDQFDLGHRRSTDLRDRIRNKYPEWYAGTVPGPLADSTGTGTAILKEEAGGKDSTHKKGSLTSLATNVRSTKAKTTPKTKLKPSPKQNQTENQPTSTKATAEPKSSNSKDSFYPSIPSLTTTTIPTDQSHLSLPTLTAPLNLIAPLNLNLNQSTGFGIGMGMGTGYELPAISTAIGEHSSHVLDDGNGVGTGTVPGVAELDLAAGVDEFEWDNTLPRLLGLDDMGVWKES